MKFLKKGLSCLIFIFSSCLATSALAGGVPMAPYFDGFYAGLGGGIVSSTARGKTHYTIITHASPKERPSITPDGITIIDLHNKDVDLGKHGVNGNIFVGFGKTLASVYYLGGELFGNLFSPKMKGSVEASDYHISTEVKNPYSFGGDIRGGYLIYPRVMLYVLFGLDYAKFKVNTDAWYITTGSMDNNFNKWKLGIIPGVGVEIGLADHLSLRAQYDYTLYTSFNHSETKLFVQEEQELNDILYTKVKPSRGLFSLKLSYLF